MKKINLSILVLLMLVGTYSCNDALDIFPEDDIPEENAYTSVPDLVLGMNAVFANYSPEANIDFSSILTDDTKVGEDNGGQRINEHNFLITANTFRATQIWTGNYALINSINRVIAAAGSITPQNAAEQATYDNILGECYALRAIAHFDLLSFYSQDYNSATESVPYIDYVVVLEQPARNTVGEVLTGIQADITTAQGLIDPSISDVTRITQDFFTALRARIALYTGDNGTAITLSQQLMNNYPIANQAQYISMFDDEDNTEVIFKADRVVGDPLAGGIWMFSNNGGSFIEVSNELVSIIPPGDVRNTTIWTNLDATFNADTQERVNKYPGSGGNRYLNDIKVFRSGEMLLINAEAKARTTDFGGAATMIQTLRTARTGSPAALPSYANLNEAMEDILFERRLELAFEGHRFLDIKRTRDITGTGIVRSQTLEDCGGASGTFNCDLAANDHRFTLPVPAAELDGNASMTQTPGYN
ncbi:RagB/SusD family nutrient uptake outer membrane protein [Kordia jejudonensis]|uniref:RagB/SusD family nutrient uptake outer membrane protein n=1 Tax=Kordia jejudonensis TaxID=1348245 RepID=UPI0006294308|nr:RagB/SusD family nutrient uptake outer membrane protein [Kordia jejudonensis]